MSIFTKSRHLSIVLVAAGLAACADDASSPSTSTTASNLDVIGLAERPASLLVLSPAATVAQRQRLERTLVRLGGAVLETHPPRLVIAQVPDGADAALTAAGMVARFDRAVTAADLAAATLPEERFLAVHAARWFPVEVPRGERLAPTLIAAEGEARSEGAPLRLAEGAVDAPVIDPEDWTPVHFASGTMVVSIVLPESNGSVDVSTEDWTEEQIRETYLKVQAALDKMAAADANADLKFVIHYESAPAAGGLEGTVDTRYEFGQRAQWGSPDEPLATADVLSSILGRPVADYEMWNASVEYTASLKARYGADSAFFVIVAANGNGTAGLRAHAWIGGPLTVLDSMYGHEVFAHEFGHIFGALDEYCPDACVSPTSLQGYLGIYNANAAFMQGGPGIDDGRGEGAPSLMQYNQPGAINGYTRGSWGWLDTDGDGIVEVRDTLPRAALTASASGRTVRVAGTITDVGENRLFSNIRYSANRIDALEYAFAAAGPWFRVALAGDTRGRQAVDVALGEVPSGTRDVWVRGINSVGNAGPAQVLRVTTSQGGNAAPHLRLDVPARAGSAAPLTVVTTALDLNGSAVQVRYDVDGNGTFDTAYMAPGAYSFTAAPGLRTIAAQARDQQGATRIVTAQVPVVSGAAAPALAVGSVPSLVHGVGVADLAFTVASPDAASLEVFTELATDDDSFKSAPAITGGVAQVTLPTPASLRTQQIDLTAGDVTLARAQVRDLAVIDADHVVVAAGGRGLWFVDITDRARPRVMSTLVLETSANKLWRHGTRLYVLGTYLTIVDIGDLHAPREWKQATAIEATVAQSMAERIDMPEAVGYGVSHFYGFDHGARIASTRVEVTVDHPRTADLTFRLVPGKGSGLAPIVLRERQHGPSGLRTFTFTTLTTPALRTLNGAFVDEFWMIEVSDDVGNGQVGALVASRLEFRTTARAIATIERAGDIAGVTSGGALIVAGAGVEALNVANPAAVTSLSRIAGTGTQTATMTGDTAILSMALAAKNPDGSTVQPPLRGFCAVDFAAVTAPSIVRCELGMNAFFNEHAQVDGRLYVGVQPICNHEDGCSGIPHTIVGDAAAFAGGGAWELGVTSERVERGAIASGSTLWTVGWNAAVTQLDVSDPANVVRLKEYPRTIAMRLLALNLPEVLLFDFGPIVRTAVLGDEHHILSRVYRIAVTARGDGDRVTRAYRTVHVIPYDHAPMVLSASVSRRDEWSPLRLVLTATDADNNATWDPFLFGRVDFDADGIWDSDWAFMGFDFTGVWYGEADIYDVRAGEYPNAIVEVRDGFWARHRTTMSLVVP